MRRIGVIGAAVVLLLLMTACGNKKETGERPSQTADGNMSVKEAESLLLQPTIETKNAEEYYKKHGKILDIQEIQEADGMLSEAQVYDLLTGRGFIDYAITTYYDTEGNIVDSFEISPDSQTKHPMYEVYYISSNEMIWIITVIRNIVSANPFSYNLQSEKEAMTIILESEYVTSFDAASKRFFDIIPLESALITRRIEVIKAETLDQITMEKLGR